MLNPPTSHSILQRAAKRGVMLVALAVQACAARPPVISSTPAQVARATFSVAVSESGTDGGGRSLAGPRPECLHATKFTGVIIPGSGDARVLMSPAYVNVERHNDKEYDALTLRVEVAEPRHGLGTGSTVTYRLGPTVDTTHASITTWQATDTLRLLVPWPAGLGERWLLFFLNYGAISHSGAMSECSTILRTDTLRFVSEP